MYIIIRTLIYRLFSLSLSLYIVNRYHHIIHIYIIKFIQYLHNTKTSQRKTRVKSERDGTNQNRSIASKIRADIHSGNNQASKPVHEKGSHYICREKQPNVDKAVLNPKQYLWTQKLITHTELYCKNFK